MGKKWTVNDLKLLKKLANKMSIREVANVMNRSYCSVEKKAHREGIFFPTFFENKAKQKDTKNTDLIYALKEELSEFKEKMVVNSNKIVKSGDTLMIQFTDWHVGKVVKNEIGNEIYNETIFKERINLLLAEMLTLLDSYIRKGTPIKDVVIMSTGDILDGQGIYASQEVNSEMSPPFQVMLAIGIIQKFILALLERDLTVTFYGVKGNHGEIREGGKSKDPNANWDLMLYLILDFWVKSFIKKEKIQIYYSELNYLNFEVRGWKYHIRHIAPIQTATSAGKAKFLGWARKHQCDVVVYGHYHHWGISDRSGITVFKGGSVVGIDELAERMAEQSEPIQLIWGCSKNRPLSLFYPVDLGRRNKK